MAAFGRRGVELLKEVVNHEPDALPSYNVRDVFDSHLVYSICLGHLLANALALPPKCPGGAGAPGPQ
jgi:hypothetical protein